MPLGDSITLGIPTPPYNGYRKPLYLSLTGSNYNIDFVGGSRNGDFADIDHEGHDGWHAESDSTIYDINDQVYGWLVSHPADIVLLHIGTNDISYSEQDANEIGDILDEIDRFSTETKVILALITNRRLDANENLRLATTQFNQDVNEMAQNRISSGDDITIVNMESVLDYNTTGGDMIDLTHPNTTGYAKMADVWFDVLDNIINPPLIVSEPIINATISQPYSYDVNVDANCYPQPTYSLTVCPNDMTIDHNTGLIEWTPTVSGDFNVTVEVSNGQPPDASQSFVITVDHSIKFDAVSSASNSSNGNILSWQHTIGDGNKRILVVGIAGEDNNATDLVISSVKYDNVYMAPVEGTSVTAASDGTYMKTELYYLLDANLPVSPGDYNVVVTYNDNVNKRCGGAISLANVEQQDREAVATNSNVDQNIISTNITTLTDNAWVVDIVGCGNSGLFSTNASDMTKRFDVNSDSSAAAGSTKAVYSAQETTMCWTFTGANRLAHSVAAFTSASYIIAGYVSEYNDMPITGASVSADANDGYDTEDITDANGYYEVWVPSGWSGTVTPMKDGYLFVPAKRTYGDVTIDLLAQNYKDIRNYDLDDNGTIGWGDVETICDNWLLVGPDVPGDIHKDEDDIVNFLDFAEFAQIW
jgi:lysophospholipase L1-like esterase